jgi:hypothetical protein
MPATWATTVKDWVDNTLVSASDLNTEIRDRMMFLKSPPTAQYVLNQASNYTTTSSTFTDVDGAGSELSLTITPAGGDVMVHFHGSVFCDTINRAVAFNVWVDNADYVADDGIISYRLSIATATSDYIPVSFTRLITGLTPGIPHTFVLRWKADGGATATLYAGAGSSVGRDIHPQFWVREVS